MVTKDLGETAGNLERRYGDKVGLFYTGRGRGSCKLGGPGEDL